MLNPEEQLQRIELTIEEAKDNIERMNALERLFDNKDFKKLILDGYFKEEASRLVMLRADPNATHEDQQKQINLLIDAIGGLRQYFNTIKAFGRMSSNALKDHEKTREEVLQEQLDGDELGSTAVQ